MFKLKDVPHEIDDFRDQVLTWYRDVNGRAPFDHARMARQLHEMSERLRDLRANTVKELAAVDAVLARSTVKAEWSGAVPDETGRPEDRGEAGATASEMEGKSAPEAKPAPAEKPGQGGRPPRKA